MRQIDKRFYIFVIICLGIISVVMFVHNLVVFGFIVGVVCFSNIINYFDIKEKNE